MTKMEDDIICVTESIEIHLGSRSGWKVVRDGLVYATFSDFGEAKELAEELAGKDLEQAARMHGEGKCGDEWGRPDCAFC